MRKILLSFQGSNPRCGFDLLSLLNTHKEMHSYEEANPENIAIIMYNRLHLQIEKPREKTI